MKSQTRKPSTPDNRKPLLHLCKSLAQLSRELDILERSPLKSFLPEIPPHLPISLRLLHMRLDGMLRSKLCDQPTDDQLKSFNDFIHSPGLLRFDDDLIA